MAQFQVTLGNQPEVFEPALNIGLCPHQLGRVEEALAILELVVNEHSERFEGYAALANLYYTGGRATQSVKSYQAAIAIDASDPKMVARLAAAQLMTKDTVAALENADRAAGEIQEAAELYLQIVDEARLHSDACFRVAEILLDAGQTEMAYTHAESALRITP